MYLSAGEGAGNTFNSHGMFYWWITSPALGFPPADAVASILALDPDGGYVKLNHVGFAGELKLPSFSLLHNITSHRITSGLGGIVFHVINLVRAPYLTQNIKTKAFNKKWRRAIL